MKPAELLTNSFMKFVNLVFFIFVFSPQFKRKSVALLEL